MIFSSPEFVFLFLPAVVFLYYILLRLKLNYCIAPVIFASSLIYYAWWRPQNVWIILASIIFNYLLGGAISRHPLRSKPVFIFGVAVNLASLFFYKYTNFAIDSINALTGASIPAQNIILPIGISFFTFQQLAYLSDIYTGKYAGSTQNFMDYCCFVCFFPQLVAGPIVHHQEMMPQFHDSANQVINWQNIFNGLVMFSIGLAKKILIADELSPMARVCFDQLPDLSFLEAICGSLCYSLQLYFDFSGYCDMAIGCALFFNIKLPWNFNSPYRATSIQDFWRRWHITLSRWLRDYLYIPLGGNRRGNARTYCNLFLTFLLGGMWHGAAWTFIIWGGLHGAAVTVHKWWQRFGIRLPAIIGWIITFCFINIAWIFFRARDMKSIEKFYDAFSGSNGFAIRKDFMGAIPDNFMGSLSFMLATLAVCAAIALFAPNSSMILNWKEDRKLSVAVMLAFLAIIYMFLPTAHPEFIYSQF